MASIWRPFAEEEEPEVIDVIAEGPTEEARSRMKIKVGERERELILNVYLHCGNKGWNAVLRKVREDIKQEPLNARLVDYYLEATDTTVIKRMQRIVREELKGQAVSTSSTSNAASQVIQNQMRYARKGRRKSADSRRWLSLSVRMRKKMVWEMWGTYCHRKRKQRPYAKHPSKPKPLTRRCVKKRTLV